MLSGQQVTHVKHYKHIDLQGVADTQKDASLLSPNMTGGMVYCPCLDVNETAVCFAAAEPICAVQLCVYIAHFSCALPWP